MTAPSFSLSPPDLFKLDGLSSAVKAIQSLIITITTITLRPSSHPHTPRSLFAPPPFDKDEEGVYNHPEHLSKRHKYAHLQKTLLLHIAKRNNT
jgi:hypothetical protein